MASKGKVLQTIVQISGEISPSLGKSIKSLTDQLEGVNVKALAVGAAMGSIAVGTAIAVGKAVGSLAELGDAYNSALNDLSATTGIVGDELADMGEVMQDVYGNNFGDSMEDVASGVSEIYRQTGLVDDALAETTKAAYALSDTFDYDIAESARAAKALMTNFGIEGEAAMGLIAAGAQNGLDYSGELLDSISEYSVQFSKLGFSADEMFSIFQQGADSGAWNLDKVGDAVKEFSIRSIDGSKTTTEAFKSLGLNSKEMMQLFSQGGDEASAAFQDVLRSLINVEDQVKRDEIGVALFGTQWEDLGVEAMAAMADIQSGAYDTENALQKINDVKYDNLGDAMEAIKRQGEVSLLPLATTIANAFLDIAPIIGEVFEEIGPIIEQVTEDSMPFVTEFLGGTIDTIRLLSPMVGELAGSVLPLLTTFVSQLLPPLLSLIQQILPPVMEIAEAVLPALSEILLSILPIATEIVSSVLPVLVGLMQVLLPVISPILDIALQLLQDVLLPLLEPLLLLIESILPAISPLLSGIISGLEPVFSLVSGIADALGVLVGWIGKIIDWVGQGLSWVVDLIFSGSVSDVAASAGANGYATGGFTNGLSIAGEDPNYPVEAVISFNPAYREQNLSYWAEAGRMLGADYSDYADFSLSGSSSGDYYDMGGVTFAPNIVVHGHADKESIMEAIEEEYDEFIDMLDEYFAGRRSTVYG